MDNLTKILILEDDFDERKQFETASQEINGIDIIGSTANATEALAIAQTQNPHAIIVDLELHDGIGNGLQFLSDLKNSSCRNNPFLLITTNNSSHTTHDAARALGADFILTKYEADYSAAYVINFIKMMLDTIMKDKLTSSKRKDNQDDNKLSFHDIPETELIEFIRNEIIRVGISPKTVGFKYLVDAVYIKLTDSHTNIYKTLGPKYKKSDPSIERAMQYAINIAWRTGDPDELLAKYTARINSDRGVPTIMEFVYFYVSKTQNYFNIK